MNKWDPWRASCTAPQEEGYEEKSNDDKKQKPQQTQQELSATADAPPLTPDLASMVAAGMLTEAQARQMMPTTAISGPSSARS